jgi:superfamily II DNA helicase RecQ
MTCRIGQKDEREQRIANILLNTIIGFAETDLYRRVALLNHFGETYSALNCGMCDNFRQADKALADIIIPAQMFLSCVKRTGELFGAGYIIEVLRGKEPVRGRLEEEKVSLKTRVESGGWFDADLFAILRKNRKEIADRANLPPFTIFHDQTLKEMAFRLPQTREDLSSVYGVGTA